MAGINTPALSAGSSVTITTLLGITSKGQATMANSFPVALSSDQSSIPVAATLNMETTKTIGVTRTADGAGNLLTSNSTSPAAHFALDTNITSILGTAPTTVGKLDVKGADGDVFVRQTTGSNLHVVVDTAPSTAVTNAGTFAVQDTVLDAAIISQEATTSGVKGLTAFGAVTTNAPTYTTTKSDALSLDTAGLLRVSLKDTPANTNKFLVTADAITIAAAQTLATVTTVGAITSITNTVGVTSNTNTGLAVPVGAYYQGGIAQTSLPTAASVGNLTGAMYDKFGRVVVLPVTIRDLTGTQTTTISASTSETTIVTQAASVFNDLLLLVISNTSATATRIDFRDTTAGTILFSLEAPATDTRGFSLGGVAIPQTSVNTNWTAQCAASVTDIRIYAVFAKNK